MVHRIHMVYRRELDHPVDEAFAWLTDYQDDDPERTEHVIERRPVIERTKDKVVLEASIAVLGKSVQRRAEVDIMPPDRWRATAFDKKGRQGDIYEYRLEPLDGGTRSRLVVDYGFIAPKLKHKVQLTLYRPFIYRKVHRMWDGFIAHMGQDLARDGPA